MSTPIEEYTAIDSNITNACKIIIFVFWKSVFVRKQGIMGKLKFLLSDVREKRIIRKVKLLLGAVFGAEEAADEEALYRDSKTLLIISGVIMSANYSAITSVPSSSENRDEGVRQGVLIPATLSLMTTLFVTATQVVMPTFNVRRVKKLIVLGIILTVYSYINFVAMKLGPISQGTVVAIIIAGIYMFFIAIVFLYPMFRIKTPQALG